MTSTPLACSMRRMMLMDASWPSNSEAAVTKRTAVCRSAVRVEGGAVDRSVMDCSPLSGPWLRRIVLGGLGRCGRGLRAAAEGLIQGAPARAHLRYIRL